MKINTKVLIHQGTAHLSILLIMACSPERFANNPTTAASQLVTSVNPAQPSTPTPAPAQTCTPATVAAITRLTKILFIVDTSGSNVVKTRDLGTQQCLTTDADYATCTPPTDPTKALRDGSVQKFLSQYSYKNNFNWSFMTFSGTAAHALVNSGNDQSAIFSTDPNVMQTALNTFMGMTDYNATPYQAAIQLASAAIQNDPDLNASSQPNYDIVFLTDGFPTDYQALSGDFDSQALYNDIGSLTALAPGRVFLNTIYYGQVNDPNAISLLRSMATLGGGQYASVNDASTGINIADIIVPSGTTTCP